MKGNRVSNFKRLTIVSLISVSLTVQELKQSLNTQPQRLARIDHSSREKLGVQVGEFVEITGSLKTVAQVEYGLKSDSGKDIIRIDKFILKSAGKLVDGRVSINKTSIQNASKIILVPTEHRLNVDKEFEDFIKKRLMGQPFYSGNDLVTVLLGNPIPFKVLRTDPRDTPVRITADTVLQILPQALEKQTLSLTGEQRIRQFLRFEWLKNMQLRISSDKVIFSTEDGGASSEKEEEILSISRKLADETLKTVRVNVSFESKGRLIGTLSWADVDLFGNVTPIYPDIQLPPPIVPPSISGEITLTPMKRCFKIGTRNCPKKITFSPKAIVVAMPFRDEFEDTYKFAIRPALEEAGFEPWKANEQINTIDVMCKVCHAIQQSGYLIANITNWNANVVFELGLAYGLAKTVILVKHKKDDVPVDLKGLEYIEYSNIDELRNNLSLFLKGVQTSEN